LGLCDDGDDPAPRAQTGSPCARVDGSPHDIVTLIVSGGTAREAQFDLMSLWASGLAGPVRVIESPSGSRAQQGGRPKRAETIALRPIASIRPIGTVSGQSDNLVLGVCRAWDTVVLRLRLAPEICSSINLQADE